MKHSAPEVISSSCDDTFRTWSVYFLLRCTFRTWSVYFLLRCTVRTWSILFPPAMIHSAPVVFISSCDVHPKPEVFISSYDANSAPKMYFLCNAYSAPEVFTLGIHRPNPNSLQIINRVKRRVDEEIYLFVELHLTSSPIILKLETNSFRRMIRRFGQIQNYPIQNNSKCWNSFWSFKSPLRNF